MSGSEPRLPNLEPTEFTEAYRYNSNEALLNLFPHSMNHTNEMKKKTR